MVFAVDPLPWAHDALASKGISKEQITVHFEKHHKGYAAKLNAAAESKPQLAAKSLMDVIHTEKGPAFNFAAQIDNHNIYWRSMSPHGGGEPKGPIAVAINKSFGSFAKFKEEFTSTASTHFGSGWVWLVQDKTSGMLKVFQGHDANTPRTEPNLVPILACDVWEHAFYIDYKQDKEAYIRAWWNVVNWEYASEQLCHQ